METNKKLGYKHYISIDWSQKEVFLARMRAESMRNSSFQHRYMEK